MPDLPDDTSPPDDAPVEVPQLPTEMPPDLPEVPPPGPENLVTEADEGNLRDQPPPGPVIYVSDERHGTDPDLSGDWHFDEDI